jgi:hypothetical protein
MAIRNAEELQESLQNDRIWRRRELSSLITAARNASLEERAAILRAFICLQYAHWEGFVKSGCQDYLRLIAARRLRLVELKEGFSMLPGSPIRKLADLIQRNEILEAVEGGFLRDYDSARIHSRMAEINTESNLRYETLQKISSLICVDLSLDVDGDYLDRRLADRRNGVAHGEWQSFELEEILELRATCNYWMDSILNTLVAAAQSQLYLR